EADLSGPVQRHRVAPLAVAATDDIEARRHRPQDPPPQPVVLVALLVGLDACGKRSDRTLLDRHWATLLRRQRCGLGVNGCPTAAERATNIRVAGDEQTASRGSSVRVGDSEQSPEAMSLLVWTTIDVSLVVS